MKARTLVSDRLYFGLDPFRLRAATSRALSRVVGLPPERARLSETHLRHDFALDTVQLGAGDPPRRICLETRTAPETGPSFCVEGRSGTRPATWRPWSR